MLLHFFLLVNGRQLLTIVNYYDTIKWNLRFVNIKQEREKSDRRTTKKTIWESGWSGGERRKLHIRQRVLERVLESVLEYVLRLRLSWPIYAFAERVEPSEAEKYENAFRRRRVDSNWRCYWKPRGARRWLGLGGHLELALSVVICPASNWAGGKVSQFLWGFLFTFKIYLV